MHGFGGYHTYMRDIPDRFETESDDRLMHSMYNQYATEGQKNGLPDGNFWLTEADARRAALEVVGTHLHLESRQSWAQPPESLMNCLRQRKRLRPQFFS